MRNGSDGARRARGRPRQFDEQAALESATQVFWTRGFAAASLDDLARAMGMNRPSVANAFGGKEDLYRQTLARFSAGMRQQVVDLLSRQSDLRGALTAFYYRALDVYCAADPAAGCFVMCTAPVEAVERPAVREFLARLIREIDEILADRFRRAQEAGDYDPAGDPKAAARLTQAVLHSLAIRARAGSGKPALRRMAREAVATLVAARPSTGS